MKVLHFVLYFSLFSFSAFAQNSILFSRIDSIPVVANSLQLNWPWAGGMNFCQFSEIDLNQDGLMDFFSFDRSGNKILTWINKGTPNTSDYVFAPEYIDKFPELREWVLLRDYNCDGMMDIFSYSIAGFAVYKNASSMSTGLQFQLVSPQVQTDILPNSTSYFTNLLVTPVDIPIIKDLDGDKDLDVLTFGSAGTTMEWHRNMSIEVYGVCDSLLYRLEDNCWGKFTENALNSNITLNTGCSPVPLPPALSEAATQRNSPERHSGSCMECINTNGDADCDLLVGDITNTHIIYLRNGDTNGVAFMDAVDPNFPSNTVTALIPIFPCPFHLDVNNDGKKDILFSPNAPNTSENYTSVWLYENIGNNDSVVSSFVEKNFLQKDMIDVGEGANPCFFDYDADGDADIFIGNYGYYSSSGVYGSKISLYRNNGTAANPIYQLITTDFATIQAQDSNLFALAPTFGDLDGDGDRDMLIGDLTGKLTFFRKDPGSTDNFVLATPNYQAIDVGNFAMPQLVDVDKDGLLDLLIGEQTGYVRYFRNTGTPTSPNFVLTSPNFGGLRVNQPNYSTGYAAPFLYQENNASVLLVGSERGYIYRYDNIDNNLTGTFALTDSTYITTTLGLRLSPCVGDVNNDTIPDLLIGNYAGGMSIYYGSEVSGINNSAYMYTQLRAWPNPADETISIESDASYARPAQLVLFSASGQLLLQQQITAPQFSLPTAELANGIYICSVQSDRGTNRRCKIVVQH
jgi:hypothetical protein